VWRLPAAVVHKTAATNGTPQGSGGGGNPQSPGACAVRSLTGALFARVCALRPSRLQQDGGSQVERGRGVAAGNPAAARGELRAKAREQRAEAGAMLFPGGAVGYR
jgi:hypothetical protein